MANISRLKNALVLSASLMTAAWASYRPIVDMQDVDQRRYDEDLSGCQGYAQQISPAGHAVGGAAIGAVFGALLGAAIGGGNTGLGARIGAVEGGGIGVANGAASQVQVIRNCMAGRGYRVLQ